jgi:hypothetical protein
MGRSLAEALHLRTRQKLYQLCMMCRQHMNHVFSTAASHKIFRWLAADYHAGGRVKPAAPSRQVTRSDRKYVATHLDKI